MMGEERTAREEAKAIKGYDIARDNMWLGFCRSSWNAFSPFSTQIKIKHKCFLSSRYAEKLRKMFRGVTRDEKLKCCIAVKRIQALERLRSSYSLFGYDSTPGLGTILPVFCSQKSLVLDEDCLWTAIFGSLQRCSIGFKMNLWLGRARSFTPTLASFEDSPVVPAKWNVLGNKRVWGFQV